MAKRQSELLDHSTLKREVARHRAAGLTGSWNDGGGLKLVLTKAGKARFVHRFSYRGRTPEHWFTGEYPHEISLPEARKLRDIDKALVVAGKDPLTTGVEALETATVAAFCRANFHRLAPKCERHDIERSDWMRDMTHRIGAVARLKINDVKLTDVAAALAHYWDGDRATPTAERLVGRIKRAVDLWHVLERPDDDTWFNPVCLKRLKKRLGEGQHYIRNHPSLGFLEAPAFMVELRAVDAMAARLAEFTILTGVRGCEARGARWQEIDWRARTWTIPACRLKTQSGKGEHGKPHIVPLSLGVVQVLRRVAEHLPCHPGDLIFPSFKWIGEKPAAPRAFTPKPARDEVRKLRPGVTLHGFRATLTAWGVAVHHRGHPPFELSLMDKVLAHTKIKAHQDVSAAMAHYSHDAGGDPFLARRKTVMREWSAYLGGRTATATPGVVVPFRKAA